MSYLPNFDSMKSSHGWSDPAVIDNFLAHQLLRGRLAIILGAGASFGFKLPGWSNLLQQMCNALKCAGPTSCGNLPQFAGDLLRNKFSGNKPQFWEAVRAALYLDVKANESQLLNGAMLRAIGALAAASSRGKVGSVVSFNFDDLLEEYLQVLGLTTSSTVDFPTWSQQTDVDVMHPHGLLPFKSTSAISERGITFTDADYTAKIGDINDPWNRKVSDVMTTHTCLFIGLSGDDERLKSLIFNANKMHPSITSDQFPFWGVVTRLADTSDDDRVSRWKEHGVHSKRFGSYDEVPDWLLGICRRAAKIRSQTR